MSQTIEPSEVSGLMAGIRQRRHGRRGNGNFFVRLFGPPCSASPVSSVVGQANTASRFRFTRLSRARQWDLVFVICCLIVVAVSVHDAALVVLNAEIIREVEQNPVGRWLIELQDGNVWLFVLVKLVGTAVAGAVLVMLYELRARLALLASGCLVTFQMVLLGYLTFAWA